MAGRPVLQGGGYRGSRDLGHGRAGDGGLAGRRTRETTPAAGPGHWCGQCRPGAGPGCGQQPAAAGRHREDLPCECLVVGTVPGVGSPDVLGRMGGAPLARRGRGRVGGRGGGAGWVGGEESAVCGAGGGRRATLPRAVPPHPGAAGLDGHAGVRQQQHLGRCRDPHRAACSFRSLVSLGHPSGADCGCAASRRGGSDEGGPPQGVVVARHCGRRIGSLPAVA
ncbi:hypothetical protein B7767_19980 [Streptomyces sp. 13-12-16]|nr:hypothetical protein B7767_19980 [Streptomyces sp. 13-12-16]